MGIERVGVSPLKCFLVNVESSESMECLFNPAELVEKIQVNWSRVAVPGLSHQLLQYQSTGNRQLPGVEFYLDTLSKRREPEHTDILAFRNFLQALTVPPGGAQNVLGGAPPRTLFVWPSVLVIETVLTDVEFRYRQFGADGQVLVYTATVTFEEVLDVRVTSEERRRGA